MLNNRDELVWGRLALLCTNQQRFEEANQVREREQVFSILNLPNLAFCYPGAQAGVQAGA